jgi:predicted nucleic acid-binding protein
MTPKTTRYIYWDSCVFLAYVNEEPGRVQVIRDIWDEIANSKDSKIVTATVSVVEAASGGREKARKQLDPQVEAILDDMWRDPSVLLVDLSTKVIFMARKLVRDAIPYGWSLQPPDAIQLATAEWVDRYVKPLAGFHTYDARLKKYSAMIGPQISEPYIAQPRLPLQEP